jgi:hypothetical protein
MRRTVAKVVWVAVPIILGVLIFRSAWRRSSLSVPQLDTAEWREICVVYLAQVGTNRQATAWSTKDAGLLQSFRESLNISTGPEHFGPGTRKNNRIDLTLRNGERWVMAINKAAMDGTSLLLRAPDNPHRSFRMLIGPDFYQTLEGAIEAATGEKVDLNASSDTLVGPDAVDFRAAK